MFLFFILQTNKMLVLVETTMCWWRVAALLM